MAKRLRCKRCKNFESFDGFSEAGFCTDCCLNITDMAISQLSKPTMVFRFAVNDTRSYSGAAKRMRNAAKEYVDILASLNL